MIPLRGTARTGDAAEMLKVADTDVHHGYPDKSALHPYLSNADRARFTEYGPGGGGGGYAFNGGRNGWREDLYTVGDELPRGGGVIIADIDSCRHDLLDEAGVDVAILGGGGDEIAATSSPDIAYANAIIRAFNDYSVHDWLTADDRFRLAIAVNPRDPQFSADEVDRLGSHPQVVSVIMPCGTSHPYGQKRYWPLYEACVRNNVAVTLHFGQEGSGTNGPPTSAGWPSSYLEGRMMRPAYYQVHLASFVLDGVFEQLPQLRVAMIETGSSWIPAYLWRLDQNWKALRYQVPWVKKAPSEYVAEHIRFSSQPIDDLPDHNALLQHLQWMNAERTLMFSSDHPHFDWDEPARTFATVDAALRKRIFWDNAAETYGLGDG